MTLEHIKEGDRVAVFSTWNTVSCQYAGKCTKTQITVGDMKFRRRGGSSFGDLGQWIEAWTSEHDELLAKQKQLRKSIIQLINYKWRDITQEQANIVLAAMQKAGML